MKLTPTERRLIRLLDSLEGRAMSKAGLAEELECSIKTVDRLISHLRREGMLEITPTFDARGAQLANAYKLIQPLEVALAL